MTRVGVNRYLFLSSPRTTALPLTPTSWAWGKNSGHKTVQTLRIYKQPSELQQVAASKLLENDQPCASSMEPKADSSQGLRETAKGQADEVKEGQLEHRSERGRENPVALSGCLFTNCSTVNIFVGKQ